MKLVERIARELAKHDKCNPNDIFEGEPLWKVYEDAARVAARCMPDNELAWVFDKIVDQNGKFKRVLLDQAIQGLKSEDGVLRSASARYLGFAKPGTALEILPGMLPHEENQYVRACMESAIRSAELGFCPNCKGDLY